MLSKVSVDEIFMHYFEKMSTSIDSHRGSAPGIRWGTSSFRPLQVPIAVVVISSLRTNTKILNLGFVYFLAVIERLQGSGAQILKSVGSCSVLRPVVLHVVWSAGWALQSKAARVSVCSSMCVCANHGAANPLHIVWLVIPHAQTVLMYSDHKPKTRPIWPSLMGLYRSRACSWASLPMACSFHSYLVREARTPLSELCPQMTK